jgi:hypothetical protein
MCLRGFVVLSCGIMNIEIVEIIALTFVVWIIAALFVAARAKKRRDAEAAAHRRFDGVWY